MAGKRRIVYRSTGQTDRRTDTSPMHGHFPLEASEKSIKCAHVRLTDCTVQRKIIYKLNGLVILL